MLLTVAPFEHKQPERFGRNEKDGGVMHDIEQLRIQHQRSMAQWEKERRNAARKRKNEVVRWDRSFHRLKTMLQRSLHA